MTPEEALDETQLVYLQLLLDRGCKFLFKTYWFGKPYVMMKDQFGQHFAERLPNES